MVQHYEYATFGQASYQNNTSAYQVSNRYTGQICDDETGLYYYGARYYDPQLGRFIQPDSMAPSDDPQTLNRYSYCGNNPLDHVDPTGHFFIEIIITLIVVAAIGAATGAIVAAATGGDIGKGALTGAISAIGICGGGIVGGAIAGVINAEITGGNVLLGALTGALSAGIAFAVSPMLANLPSNYIGELGGYLLCSGAGAIGGGIGAEIEGGDFWAGAEAGAIGGAVGYGLATVASSWSNDSSDSNMSEADKQHYLEKGEATYNDKSGGVHGLPGDISLDRPPPPGFDADFTPAQGGYRPILAFRGSGWRLSDWTNNIEQAFGLPSKYYSYASYLGARVAQQYPDVVFVGHSLGGGLALQAYVATGAKNLTVTFNAAGLSSFRGGGPNVVNFFVRGEILTTLQDLTPLPRAWGTQIPYSFGPFGHGIANFH
jgi:RHS repeat-associated protein